MLLLISRLDRNWQYLILCSTKAELTRAGFGGSCSTVAPARPGRRRWRPAAALSRLRHDCRRARRAVQPVLGRHDVLCTAVVCHLRVCLALITDPEGPVTTPRTGSIGGIPQPVRYL